ncbi:hypothetical protein VTN00DRAFT_4277 [Thermoascus crustaceus]|uniref:uncharacterized protein n=1 Tax=Thermoascus crustaceus TaxID=5088 RepID=UPI003743046D
MALNAHSLRSPAQESRKITDKLTRPAPLTNRLPPASNDTKDDEPSQPPEAGSVKDKIGRFSDNSVRRPSHNTLENGMETPSPRVQTPQQIAAQLAAERYASRTPSETGFARTLSPEKNGLPRSMSFNNGGQSDNNKMQIPPSGGREHHELPAPKPIRNLSSKNTVLEAGDDAWHNHGAHTARETNSRSSLPDVTADSPSPAKTAATNRPANSSVDHIKNSASRRGSAMSLRSVNSPLGGRRNSKGQLNTPPPSVLMESPSTPDEQKPKLPPRRISQIDGLLKAPAADPAVARRASTPEVSSVRSQTDNASTILDQPIGMDEDSLADAIVASSLASSHAPSPMDIPPPPPPRRRPRSRSLLHPGHIMKADNPRTPSPPRGLRHTLRDHSKHEEEKDKRHKMRVIRTHPHKHHEGDRKRYKDEVTERQRKRYEGVWAANKGLWIPGDRSELPFPIREQESAPYPQEPSEMVLNLVVRDIWSRSRLPTAVLEQIWNLVDRHGIGMLTRDEFVVGMWLIDQQLKGRKLPVKVSDSVWESVKHVSGIKVPI